MTMRTTARLFSIAILSLGLITGCATTDENQAASGPSPAEQAITAAKTATAEAKGLHYEWRDTGKIIKKAEKALTAGNEAKALKLANKALKQSQTAIKQAKFQDKKYLDTMSVSYKSSDVNAAASNQRGATAGRVNSYSVVRGDNLWNISGKSDVYANPYQWPLIYKTNRNKIKDPDLIFPGQVFDIDQNASAAQIDAAVNHAKTRGAWTLGDIEQSDKAYLAQ